MIATLAVSLMLAAAPATTPAWTESEMTLPSTPGALYGTLTTPAAKPRAAALILAGSGPTDRDGNSTIPGVMPATLRWLAHDLADRGVTTLRTDKRAIGASRGAATSEADLRFTTYVEDAKAWAHALKLKTGARCVWLIGHSEGALIAEVVAQDDAEICGTVLLSGAGRKAGVVLREQLAAMPEPTRTKVFAALSELEAGRTVDPAGLPPSLFRASVQPYLISWLALDPAALARTAKGPMLILHGRADLQVATTDAELLAKARPDARYVELDGVTHVLKAVASADPAAQKAVYADPSIPLAPTISDTVADFIKARR